jgi:hypothetical protein
MGMAYMLLVIEKVGDREARSPGEGSVRYERMVRFSMELKERGLLSLSQSLKTEGAGVRFTRTGEQPAPRDGPFAEAKELIGGILLLNCETRDQASAIARACPAAEWAAIEVRELGPCF